MHKSFWIEKPMASDTNGDRAAGNARCFRSVTVNLAESPLSWLASRNMLTEPQLLAGDALRRDFEVAGLAPHVTMRWDAPPNAKVARGVLNPGAATLAQIDAKRRFEAAIDAAGQGLSDILWRVVCARESVPTAEKSLGWPTRTGRVVLTIALDRLASHYRIG
ncbi:MAG: DUF6456 domain-containing protein [Sphingomonadaceae bacterium]